ncbi:hypothetical protein CRUP_006312 [Coryphaenoides rupestris]|nr:hypothetical protein CRUP_006312 [Coryphaenoides rupestris]
MAYRKFRTPAQQERRTMFRSALLLLLLCGLTLAGALRCYACLFPAISPMDCLKFPQECPAGQRCLSSTAESIGGPIKIYEKSCSIQSQCGLSGYKFTAGYYFNYSNVCCDTDLCNAAAAGPLGAPAWRQAVLLGLLPLLLCLLVV